MASKTTVRRTSRTLPPGHKRFLRRPEVCEKIGLSASSIYAMERAGNFPQHILLTPHCAVWDEAQVEAWMQEREKAPATPAFMPPPPRKAVASR